jgi:uncharacterized repeat protein (TIGR02543 family)
MLELAYPTGGSVTGGMKSRFIPENFLYDPSGYTLELTESGDLSAVANTYTLTYSAGDGTAPQQIRYTPDTPTFALPAPVRSGYTFLGWQTANTGNVDMPTLIIPRGSAGDKAFNPIWAKDTKTTVHVTGVSLPSPLPSTLEAGSVWQASAVVSPANATDPSVVWYSSDEAIATVDATGVIRAFLCGTVTITGYSIDGGHLVSGEVTVVPSTAPVLKVSGSAASAALSLTVTNPGGSRSANLFAAWYDADGRLLGCAVQSAALTDEAQDFSLDRPAGTDGAALCRVFILGSAFEPLCAARTLS